MVYNTYLCNYLIGKNPNKTPAAMTEILRQVFTFSSVCIGNKNTTGCEATALDTFQIMSVYNISKQSITATETLA